MPGNVRSGDRRVCASDFRAAGAFGEGGEAGDGPLAVSSGSGVAEGFAVRGGA